MSSNYIECESNGGRNKTLSVEEYLNKIRPHLKDIVNDLKKADTWKIQLTANNFISSIDNDEEHVMHSNSDNIETMIIDEADEVIKLLFDSLKDNIFKCFLGSIINFHFLKQLFIIYSDEKS